MTQEHYILSAFTDDGITLWSWDDPVNSLCSQFFVSEQEALDAMAAGEISWGFCAGLREAYYNGLH